jgi:hypothetical protein
MKTLLAFGGGLAVLVVALVLASGAAAFDQSVIPFQPGNPLVNGCPAGYEALQLSDLALYAYHLPFLLDNPANGGNGDGVVCGKPLSAQEQATRFPNVPVPIIFEFGDNGLTPSH